jgi:SHAQKYF class myb-like DNA-binding protein
MMMDMSQAGGLDVPPQQQLDPGAGGQGSLSLSAQAELELELSLRGSLLVQQQRRIVQLEDELQRAWAEIERLRTKLGSLERDRAPLDDEGSRQPRYWTPEEHTLFVEAVQRYGWKDVKAISQHVGTRNPTQVRTHAQKLLLRQQKEQHGVMMPAANGREVPTLPPDLQEGGADGSHGEQPLALDDGTIGAGESAGAAVDADA